jgi:hypothetical protein
VKNLEKVARAAVRLAPKRVSLACNSRISWGNESPVSSSQQIATKVSVTINTLKYFVVTKKSLGSEKQRPVEASTKTIRKSRGF